MTRYRIHIEEVVIDGIDAGSRGAFSDALHRELEVAVLDALANRGLGLDGLAGSHIEVLEGAPIHVAESHLGRSLASGAARSIAGTLSRSTTEGQLGGGGHHGD